MTDKPREKRNLIPLKQACQKGHFGRTKAYELIGAGKIIAYKDGGRIMIDADSIDDYHATLPKVEPRAAREQAVASS
ncbi:helix-turn-helix domain-containing protein [Bradyrhizobium sp. CCBAU 45384]|uniref:helix-turn-helix domain-containing protein n=1 Tax=Bradyrhizobium sp. CCBAU 45384 TaxID=858428 RepID=UPI002306D108|nr:helix-turn-helix domain-containing protein [Bradyrhizobium sp. CCBAU 45384]MDA9405562.1 hypothetical protein [Bradyrhizobium sp. CCBAU 45384]